MCVLMVKGADVNVLPVCVCCTYHLNTHTHSTLLPHYIANFALHLPGVSPHWDM